mgnify:CR=1 FL=1
MHPSLPRLIELQEVDVRLAEVQAKLDSLPRRVMAVNKRVEDARQQLADAKAHRDPCTYAHGDDRRHRV